MVRCSVALCALFAFAACDGCASPPDGDPGADAGVDDAGAVACANDAECAFGEQCRNGACVPAEAVVVDDGCTDDADCAQGLLCAVSTGRCLEPAPTPDVPTGPPGPCNDGDQRTCGIKIGRCDYGVELCDVGQWSGVCLGATGPGAESCNGEDDDCDTLTDEDFDAGRACTDGVGACQQAGVVVCTPDGLSTICTANGLNPAGRVERCGVDPDDDCDGAVEEGFTDVGDACTIGSGLCAASGVVECTGDALATWCNAPTGGETCNGADDNGNGCIDEGFDVGVSCSEGIGPCARAGQTVCAGDGLSVVCDAVPGVGSVERCNDVDDDCNSVTDDGCDSDGDGYCDGAITFDPAAAPVAACPLSSAGTLDCNDTNPAISPGDPEICNNGVDEDCDGSLNNGCTPCNSGIDADFDGANQCVDCDETNGGVRPGAVERCDGVDQDCDGSVDEGFDRDGDTYTTCGTLPGGGTDPARIDCNDDPASGGALAVPGGCELCKTGAAGPPTCNDPTNDQGTGADEDCDGYIDENCFPCDPADGDRDGVTGCEGDCDNADPTVRPGIPEVCEGADTDCNRFTTENCDVGDPCGFPAETDVCRNQTICVTPVNRSGNPIGPPFCASLCNLTSPGLGREDSCGAGEACGAGLVGSENLHLCTIPEDFGNAGTGVRCSRDSDCRSGFCLSDQRLTGPPDKYCSDLCTHDASCPAGFTCQSSASAPQFGSCLRTLTQQDLAPGEACTAGTAPRCENGSASCLSHGGQQRCRDLCCHDTDCASNERCAFVGPEVVSSGQVASVPLCVPDSVGNGGRLAGAACTANTQCESEICDVNLGVCVDPCCHDTMCPTGLTCELTDLVLASGNEIQARLCLNQTPAAPIEAR